MVLAWRDYMASQRAVHLSREVLRACRVHHFEKTKHGGHTMATLVGQHMRGGEGPWTQVQVPPPCLVVGFQQPRAVLLLEGKVEEVKAMRGSRGGPDASLNSEERPAGAGSRGLPKQEHGHVASALRRTSRTDSERRLSQCQAKPGRTRICCLPNRRARHNVFHSHPKQTTAGRDLPR